MYEVETVTTRNTPAAERAALWSETVTAFQGTHSYRYGYPVPERFDATATRQRSARFQLVTWHIAQAQTIRRDRTDDDDAYRLLFPLAGPADLGLSGDDHRLTPADGVLFAPGAPFDLRLSPGSRGLVATLPRAEVEDRIGRNGHRLLHLGRAPGRVLALMLSTLVDDRAAITRRTFDTLCGQAVELACLVAGDRAAVPEHDLAAQIRLVVRRYAHDPGLTGAALARHVGWSLRQVQAVLQRQGTTPSALIREVRLELARDLLDRPATITAVARASGFHSIDAFEKAFRRRHGMSPSEYRRS
ncbi:AraC family transcriptional regulator [Pseudonocardia sp. GCM10023141]